MQPIKLKDKKNLKYIKQGDNRENSLFWSANLLFTMNRAQKTHNYQNI